MKTRIVKESRDIIRRDLFKKIAKAFKLTSENDNITKFSRADGEDALIIIAVLRRDLINNFPLTNVLKCKAGVHTAKDAITVFRQLARFYNKRVISYRLKVPGTRGRVHRYEYKLSM